MKFRLIVKVDNMGPEGQSLAPTFRTVDIECPALETALKCGTYSQASVIGAERLPEPQEDAHGR